VDKSQHPTAPLIPGVWPLQEHCELNLKCDSRGALPAGSEVIEEDYADVRLAVGVDKLDEVTERTAAAWAILTPFSRYFNPLSR